MIIIKNKASIEKMARAGQVLAQLFEDIEPYIQEGRTSAELDAIIQFRLQELGLKSQSLGYKGYRHVSCISVNDEVVHGVPNERIFKKGDLVKVDVCASLHGYCADMARAFFVGDCVNVRAEQLVKVAQSALDKGIEQARPGNRLGDISAAIQHEVERHGFGIVREFAGHGIGKLMHEDPEILNYGRAGTGPVLRAGMTFAIEPMITMGDCAIVIDPDGWTVKTKDKSLAAHVEDTVLITDVGPKVLTRVNVG